MIYGQIAVFLLLILGQSRALIEDCHVDNSICTNQNPPKLHVAYSAHIITCNDIIYTLDVTSAPRIAFSQGKEGNYYVLVFMDPDAPFPCAQTDGSSFVHYISVVQLVSSELKPEQNVISYMGPHPPAGTHRYQFYLFSWTFNDSPVIHNTDDSRHNFMLKRFVKENHLNQSVAVFQLRVPH